MELEWNRLTDAERAEFSVWRQQRLADLEAKLKAKAEAAAKPKLYVDMTSEEKRRWRQTTGIPINHVERL